MKALSENSKLVRTDCESIRAADLSSRMLGAREAAAYLNISKSWLDKRRVFGGGPPYTKFGRRVNYSIADLDDFAARNRRQNTS
jgi:hypothetical protein